MATETKTILVTFDTGGTCIPDPAIIGMVLFNKPIDHVFLRLPENTIVFIPPADIPCNFIFSY